MRIPRIFHSAPLDANTRILLDADASRHVGRVLRLGKGDALTLFDGSGGEYPATIVETEKREIWVECASRHDVENESPLLTTLAQGVSKGERMDYTIQKAVELGINRIVPLDTSRSVVNLKGERLQKRMDHWRGVIISACEQCGRNRIPELLPMQSLQQWLQQPLQGHGLLLDHRATETLVTLPSITAVTLLIGPEGGLNEGERLNAQAAGYRGVRLGPRVLRTETAALTALSAIQLRWGDLG